MNTAAEIFFAKFDDLADSADRISDVRKFIVSSLIHEALNDHRALQLALEIRSKHLESHTKGSTQVAVRRRDLIKELAVDDLPPQLRDLPVALFGRLGEISTIEKGLSPIQRTKPGPYPLVATAEERGSSDTFDFVGPAVAIPLVSSTGHGHASLKRIHYQEGKFAAGNILAVVKPTCPRIINARFLYEYLTAFKEELLVARMSGTANVSLTINKLKEVPVPLITGPALQRLDELMALCDRLEAQQQERQTRHADLARASLARFAAAPTPANLHFLFHKSYTIPPADLRKSILTLAVQGKLVEPDPGEEPVDGLLMQMQERRAQLVDAKKVRKPRDLPPVAEDEPPFSVPVGWRWTRWGQICDWITYGFTRPMAHVEKGQPIVTAKNVQDGFMTFENCHCADASEFARLNPKDLPRKGDILITKDGTIGRAAIVDTNEPFCINQSVAVLWLESCLLYRPFMLMVIRSPFAQGPIWEAAEGMAIKHLSITDFGKMILPVPPLAEQRRIVAKVDQLMALVDELETQLAASRATAKNLLEALVAELTATP